MESLKSNVLIVDDEKNILKTMSICLEDMGLKTTQCSDPQQAVNLIKQHFYELAFIDLKMSPISGMEVLQEIKYCSPETTAIIITAHGSIDSAVEAIKNGAYSYLQKPFDYIELQLFTKKVLEYHELKKEVITLRKESNKKKYPGNIITQNTKMREMIQLANEVAPTNLSVLIEGDSGTGKELFADLIFQGSSRNEKPFIKINCAALNDSLLESELFGHVKGAFTGAAKDRIGRFELADSGTIFLDEIAELSPKLQAKLLRILQNKEYERLGESITRSVDVRIIAATNKNLEEAIKEGTFRDDLFYRLNSVRLKLLPLRERPEDIILLAQYFINKFSSDKNIDLDTKTVKILKTYRWYGNVRELQNTIERAVVVAKSDTIYEYDLPEELRSFDSEQSVYSLEENEKIHIKKILQISNDLTEASQILGIDPATLWRKRKKYGL